MTSHVFRSSVGHLAEFVHRRGDLGGRGGPMVQAIEGIRRQQGYQQQQGGAGAGGYEREVTLRHRWSAGDLVLEIAGRADAVDRRADVPRVEEIKTYRGDLEAVREANATVHDAQALLYAALLAMQEGLAGVGTRLVYLEADSGQITCLNADWTRAALADFLSKTCTAYAEWLLDASRRRAARDASLSSLPFPRAHFRPGQRMLARSVWQALAHQQTLLAEAPTGTGKTLAVLYAALRHQPRSDASRLLYATARGPGRRSALAAVEQLVAAGARLRAVDLVARDKLCFLPGTPCTGMACPYARGYYDRRRAALAELLDADHAERAMVIDGERTATVARRHQVCPAALQNDAARWADLIIADMNHLFDPLARKAALLDPEEGGAAVLVDEAHNLEQRARDMFSGTLDCRILHPLHGACRSGGCPFTSRLGRLLRKLEGLDGEAPENAMIDRIADDLEKLVTEAGTWLGQAPSGGLFARVRAALGDWLRWLAAWQEARAKPGGWALCIDGKGGQRCVALRCLAPGDRLAREYARFRGLVLFSATLPTTARLTPVLGLSANTRSLRLPSAFPAERSPVWLVTELDMRLRHRQAALEPLSRLIVELVEARPGHHLVFVSSFAYLGCLADAVGLRLRERAQAAEILRQSPRMDDASRTAFLDALGSPDGRTRVAVAISGGVFGEGIDLAGDCLVGVVVAGLPLPPPDVERNAIRDYHGADGFEVAFRIPAMTRLLQAAGRLIRSEEDAGIVCLVDRRLADSNYRNLLRPEWTMQSVAVANASVVAHAFWTELDNREPLEHHENGSGAMPAHALAWKHHAQDEDHLHHRPGHGQLSHARETLRCGDERGAAEHVPRGPCLGGKDRQLDPHIESQGALPGADSARHPGSGNSNR